MLRLSSRTTNSTTNTATATTSTRFSIQCVQLLHNVLFSLLLVLHLFFGNVNSRLCIECWRGAAIAIGGDRVFRAFITVFSL